MEALDYGDVDEEREAVRRRVGLRDTAAAGLEMIDGPDAVLLLAELTGVLEPPEPLSVTVAQLPRYSHPIVVIALDKDRFAVRTAAADTSTLVDAVATALHIDHREWRVVGEAVGESLASIAVLGPEAAPLVARALAVTPEPDGVTDLDLYEGWLWRSGSGSSTVIELRISAGRVAEVWRLLLAAGREQRVRPIGALAVPEVADLVGGKVFEAVGVGQ